MNYNLGQKETPTPSVKTIADELRDTVGNIGARLDAVNERLNSLSLRACGGEEKGQSTQSNPPRPVPNGALHGLEMMLNDIAAQVEDLHNIASRLERIA